jgi:hypothetical protein
VGIGDSDAKQTPGVRGVIVSPMERVAPQPFEVARLHDLGRAHMPRRHLFDEGLIEEELDVSQGGGFQYASPLGNFPDG